MVTFLTVCDDLLETLQGNRVQFALSDLLGCFVTKFSAEEVPVFKCLENWSEFVSFRVIEKNKSLFLRTVDSLELESK